MNSLELRALVALGCRILGTSGHDDFTLGHASARDPQGRGAWMKANDLALAEVQADNVVLLARDGEILEGQGRRHVEFPIHTELYAARPDVMAVVHTHPSHAVALGAAGVPLLPVSHGATLFVPPDIPRFDLTSELISTEGMGAQVARTLENRSAMLLVNHGIVTIGSTLQEAVVRAVVLERSCRQQLLTAQFNGGWPRWTPDDEARAKQQMWGERTIRSFWDLLVRDLERGTDPRDER